MIPPTLKTQKSFLLCYFYSEHDGGWSLIYVSVLIREKEVKAVKRNSVGELSVIC